MFDLEKVKEEYNQIYPERVVFESALLKLKSENGGNKQSNGLIKSKYFFNYQTRYASAIFGLVMIFATSIGGYNYYKFKSFDNLITITESDIDVSEDDAIESIVENDDSSLFNNVIFDIEL